MRASPFLLSRTELFLSWKQATFALALLLLLFSYSLLHEYRHFGRLTEFDDYITTAWVEKQYRKNDYWVLKLQSSDGFSFYTSSKEDIKYLGGEHLRIRIFTEKLDFLSYLKSFYAPIQILARIKEKEQRYILMEDLEKVHTKTSAPLYSALLFAGPIPLKIRHQLSALGINHLLAISGFHLGVLSFLLLFLIKSVYQPVQGIYFPYRNAHRDIAVLVLMVLLAYLNFLDFVPSLLRAYAMTLFAYVLYDRGMRIISFTSLLIVVSSLIALWPKLLFALGFWFSVAGVFYIFLFLHHMKELKVWQSFILLHIWVYLAMLPLVHFFYGSFSLYQLYSPLLSMLFILFYPLVLISHLLSIGEVLDPILDGLLSLDLHVIELFTDIRIFFLYLFISLLAVIYRVFFLLLFLFGFLFLSYLLYRITEF